jgi:hypothetical protein
VVRVNKMNNTKPQINQKQQRLVSQTAAPKRKRQRKANPNKIVSVPFNSMITPGPTFSGEIMRPKRIMPNIRLPKLTAEGLNFLKCAFAPPDFSADQSDGIPDGFTGRSLTKKHKIVQPITFRSGPDYYILVAPVPGIAYYLLEKPAGIPVAASDFWPEIPYSDTTAIFGPATGTQSADTMTAFRTASLCAELVPTTNAMSWSGNIQCFKVPVFEGTNTIGVVSGTPGLGLQANGLESTNSTIANMYAAPFNLGVFASAGNMNKEFEFTAIREGMGQLPNNLDVTQSFGQLGGANVAPYTGLGSTESILIKISGLSTTCTALVKVWSCVEYKVNVNNPLYEYSKYSPREDALALECYRQIFMSMPPAVSYFDNSGLWERILNIIRTVSGAVSFVPGPYGTLAKGVNIASEALSALTI